MSAEKHRGFAQGIYAISSSKKEAIGTKRTLQDGREFRYAKAGAAALASGKLGFSTQPNTGWLHKACPVVAAGKMQLTLTVTAGGALAENELENGLLIINFGGGTNAPTGVEVYPISGNSELAAGGTTLYVTLKEPLRTALTASDYFRIQPNTWSKVVETATEENVPAGTPLVNVTAAYYYWCQTKGVGIGRLQMKRNKAQATMSLVVGGMLIPSVSAGYLEPLGTVANGGSPKGVSKYPVAIFNGLANTLSAYVHHGFPVVWNIPGA